MHDASSCQTKGSAFQRLFLFSECMQFSSGPEERRLNSAIQQHCLPQAQPPICKSKWHSQPNSSIVIKGRGGGAFNLSTDWWLRHSSLLGFNIPQAAASEPKASRWRGKQSCGSPSYSVSWEPGSVPQHNFCHLEEQFKQLQWHDQQSMKKIQREFSMLVPWRHKCTHFSQLFPYSAASHCRQRGSEHQLPLQ